MRTADDETAGWVQVVNGSLVKELLGHNLFDNVLLEIGDNLLLRHLFGVLRRDDNRVHPNRSRATMVFLVLDGYLSFAIGTNPRKNAYK